MHELDYSTGGTGQPNLEYIPWLFDTSSSGFSLLSDINVEKTMEKFDIS